MDSTTSSPQNKLKFLQRGKKSTWLSSFNVTDSLGIILISNFAYNTLILFFLALLYGAQARLANKPAPSLVQLNTGETTAVEAIGNKERTAEVIKAFTIKTMSDLFTWTGRLPGKDGVPFSNLDSDPGVEINGKGRRRGKISTQAWKASFALADDFRDPFLLKLVDLTPSNVFKGKTQFAFVPQFVREPIKIKEGEWTIDLVGTLTVLDTTNNLPSYIPFNKQVHVRAVEPPKYSPGMAEDSLPPIIAKAREKGLEVVSIKDLDSK
ncbi:MAG: hypothetical protein F6J98_04115 [Moorea sp. SIO4G2]|uniref:hypothetical protein n=1 Tax=unclassified Moorena TaxID=2683338 RepID=UPI0013BAA7E8|nr:MULTISPECIES: hypothetical protein [unclassified Moorena]NEO10940.1 hypothetical protein [Moorena sp. SIO3E8]NEO59634.1 hypothetical protein [Moorena sp. SIO4G2]NEP99054.1 hypothetical protein [Moorena sp. SIO3F7]NEQ79562.1 hypothetical protein [Moorena sp. SIO2I5]